MGLHVMGCFKGMIFILNPNPTSLNFYESLLFNTNEVSLDAISDKLSYKNSLVSSWTYASGGEVLCFGGHFSQQLWLPLF